VQIRGDLFACKCRLHFKDYFTYNEKHLKCIFHKWQFGLCHTNTGIYLQTYDKQDVEQLSLGQVTALRYTEEGTYFWKGKVRLKKWRKYITLMDKWVFINFHCSAIEEWIARPSRWHSIKPGKPKVHQEVVPVVHSISCK